MYGSLKFTESVLQMVNLALSVVGGETSWIMQFTLLAQFIWMKRVKYNCDFVQTSQQLLMFCLYADAYIVRQRVAITSFSLRC